MSSLLLTPRILSLPLTLKTTPSCPGLIAMPQSTIYLIAGSVEHSVPHQLKTSHGGFLRFKERTFFNSIMTSKNPKMDWYNIERATGREARGRQTEERGCKCQTFLSLLSGRRKQTSDIFFPSLYKFKRRFLLKCCVAMTPGFT